MIETHSESLEHSSANRAELHLVEILSLLNLHLFETKDSFQHGQIHYPSNYVFRKKEMVNKAQKTLTFGESLLLQCFMRI